MEKDPLCSVLITTHNSANFIEHTIESVFWQTFFDREILIVDNDSTDNTRKTLERHKSLDKRIKTYKSETNLGPFGGLNFLLKKAKGKYIAILDHDDIRHPDKLTAQIDLMDKNNHYIGCGSTFIDIREGENFCKYELFSLKNVVMHSSLVFRNLGYRYDNALKIHCDRSFMLRTLAKDGDIFKINKALVLRRMRNNGENVSKAWSMRSVSGLFSSRRIRGIAWYEYLYNIFVLDMKNSIKYLYV